MDNIKKIEKDFLRLINQDKLFHAYLFFGEDEGGIFSFTENLANFLENREFTGPGKFLNDFLVIRSNENGNIGIDETRKVQEFLFQKPVISRRRVAVILGAQDLTDEAQSSVLKVIEEPPQNTLIVLISRNDDLLLPTIVSRVHRIFFPMTQDNTGKTRIYAGKSAPNKINDENIEDFIKTQLSILRKDLIKNSGIIREILNRCALLKRYNLNKKLQLRFLNSITGYGRRKTLGD